MMFGISPELLQNFLNSLNGVGIYIQNLFHAEYYRIFKNFYDIGNSKRLYPENVHEFLKHIGTAQGSPLSPYLSALALDEIEAHLPPDCHIVMYADDFIIYGDNIENTMIENGEMNKLLTSLGFTPHENKSGYIKKGGIIQKSSLKFLGLEYNFEEATLQGKTRNGSTLMFNKHTLTDTDYDINYCISNTTEYFTKKVEHYRKAVMLHRQKDGAEHMFLSDLYNYYLELLSLKELCSTKNGPDNRFGYDYYSLLQTLSRLPRGDLYVSILQGILNLNSVRVAHYFVYRIFNQIGALQVTTYSDLYTLLGKSTGLYPTEDPKSRGIKVHSTYHNKLGNNVRAAYNVHYPGNTEVFPWSSATDFVQNGYLGSYRSKYTFNNFIRSRFMGLIQSRMYLGTWNIINNEQDFRLKSKKYALCRYYNYLQYLPPDKNLTIFNGTSFYSKYLVNELTRRFNCKNLQVNKVKTVHPVKD